MGDQGLTSPAGPASPPYRNGPYNWDQPVTFSAGIAGANTKGKIRYVDGTSGSDSASGKGWGQAFATIQQGVTSAGANGIVYVAPIEMAAGATDPGSYTESVIIPATHESLSIIGISTGRAQGGLPQLKIGTTTTTALLTIRSPGCLIANMGFNGAGATGGGILLDDDGSTKTAFGTSIYGCHFKNCVGTTATNAATGGAIQWSAAGNAWQVHIANNRFYKCVGDIVLLGTSGSVPQDVVIENNVFSGPAANVDCNLYLAGGSGMNGVMILNNHFPCDPALGSGTNHESMNLTGCVGTLSHNTFGFTGLTLGDGTVTGGTIPATVFMIENYQEDAIITRTS